MVSRGVFVNAAPTNIARVTVKVKPTVPPLISAPGDVWMPSAGKAASVKEHGKPKDYIVGSQIVSSTVVSNLKTTSGPSTNA
jgi:hypothetical protein